MLVYIAHPFKGLQENADEVAEIILEFALESPEHTFISPIHTFGFMFNTTDYEHGLNMCLKLLSKCDMMMVSGDWTESVGVNKEIEFCKQHNIPVIFI